MEKLFLLLMMMLTACTSVSPTMFTLPESDPELRGALVSKNNDLFGKKVRWGGEIIKVKQENGFSIIEMKHYPLMRNGFP